MNLFIDGPDGGIVYNSMNLHTGKDWTLTQVGSGNTPLSLAVSGAEPTAISGTLNLFTSGVVQVDTDDPLNLRVRGF
jgi:predicted metal-dependent peptidase